MEKIRLLVILEATLGGIRKHVVDLLTSKNILSKFDITFVYSLIRADEQFISDLEILRSTNVHLIQLDMTRNVNVLNDFIVLSKLIKVVNKLRPHIVHLHGAKAGALGRLTFFVPGKRVYVYTPHGGSFHKFNSFGGYFYFLVEKFLSFFTHNFIAVSKYSYEQIHSELRIKKGKITLINNGININNFHAQKSPNLNANLNNIVKNYELVILYPALFFEAKGHLQFIKALKESTEKLDSKTLILFAGFGPLENIIRFSIFTYKLENNIKLIGFWKNIQELYNICDIVILPSVSEVFGYVILEAMANYKPVIATKVGAIPELIIDGVTGELIDPKDLTKFVPKFNFYSKNKGKLLHMGINGRKYVETHYSLNEFVMKTEKNYINLLRANNINIK